MTDRHIHCVYFKYDDVNRLDGYCLLKQEKIGHFYADRCEDIVLKPSVLLSYYIKHNNMNMNWSEVDERALDYLEDVGFNDYPKCKELGE